MKTIPTQRFCLHLVVGPPASGKTTFACQLAAERRAALVDIDVATEPIVRAALAALGTSPDDRDSPFFKNTFRDPIYDALFAIADSNLDHVDVVLTGPFTREFSQPDWLEDVALQCLSRPAPVIAYYMDCPPKELFERLKRRANPRDAAKLADWDTYHAYYGNAKPPLFPHRRISATTSS